VTVPQTWLLGSSGNSAVQAGRMGVGYSFAQFFTGTLDKSIFDLYKKNFAPSAAMPEKQISVAFHAIVADTREEALYEELPYAIFKMQLFRGMMRNHLMTPEQAAAYPLTEIEKQLINDIRKTHIIGTAKEAGETLLNLQEQYGFDEAMIISMPHSQKARLKTYSLLAQELL
jgi:alkanesulfonate monooxygenase SsuD/methylene tetrahydromethanopterin reductase-like flavin-dependent oxidoreductase (luciferase family)